MSGVKLKVEISVQDRKRKRKQASRELASEKARRTKNSETVIIIITVLF